MSAANADQRTFWNDQAGPVWVAQMHAMDAALAPVLDTALATAAVCSGERVLDIGCGAGTSTRQIADLVGPTGKVVGLDISHTLLALAQSRKGAPAHLSYLAADAQTYNFPAGEADLIFSRFGVMFFDDFVAAFANLRRALSAQGRLTMATWGDIAENPYFTMPAAVSKNVLGPVPRSDPDLPGPFALRDPERIEAILRAAGFSEIAVDTQRIDLTPPGDPAAVAHLLCEIGPAQRALSHYDPAPDQRAALVTALETALQDYRTPQGVRIPAAIHIVTALKGA